MEGVSHQVDLATSSRVSSTSSVTSSACGSAADRRRTTASICLDVRQATANFAAATTVIDVTTDVGLATVLHNEVAVFKARTTAQIALGSSSSASNAITLLDVGARIERIAIVLAGAASSLRRQQSLTTCRSQRIAITIVSVASADWSI
jgi:hypothetical protein